MSTLNTDHLTERFDDDMVLFIDLLRGIAAIMVMFGHALDLSTASTFSWDLHQNPPFWCLIRSSIGNGVFWVWCFFIISGMCIHQSIARSVETQTFRWRNYIVARLTRIYPLFLLGLVLAYIAWILPEDWGDLASRNSHPWPQLAASFLSLQIFTTPFPAFETSWSLSCEMVYYAVWPILLLSFRGNGSRAAIFALFGSCLTLIAIAAAWHFSERLSSSAALEGLWTTVILFPLWAGGAWLGANWRSVRERMTTRLWVASIIICILAEVLFVSFKFHVYPGWALNIPAWVAAPGLLLFLGGVTRFNLSQKPKWKPACEWLGRFSYPCYILHMQLLLIWHHFLIQWLPKSLSSQPFVYMLCLLLPLLALMAVVGPWMESQIMSWRSQILKKI
jgi:peptidoglycan/LPS O-acetylase OafA/YrhL